MDKIDAVGAIADYNAYPDASGHFGRYGGIFVAETLIEPLRELDAAYRRYKDDPDFVAELQNDYRHYVGRPSPIYEAARLSKHVGGARILLKREDLNHTGALMTGLTLTGYRQTIEPQRECAVTPVFQAC